MSQSSAPPGPTSHHSPQNVGVRSTNANLAQDKQTTSAIARTPQSTAGVTALPPLATLAASTEPSISGSPTTWRSTGLHSILNPTEHSSSQQTRLVQTTDARSTSIGSPHGPRSFASPRGRKRGESHSPGFETDAPASFRHDRRILTPRSPGVRAASLGAHRSPSIGSSLGSHVPGHGPEGRHYIAEPGKHNDSVVPPMPPLPVTRGALPAIQTAEHDHRTARRASTNTATPLTTGTLQPSFMSSGVSGPASGFTQQRPQSPVYQPSQHHAGTVPALNAEGGLIYAGLHGSTIGQGLPRVQSGWKMALETGQGREVVDINIDYQQASKMADEKRKRNAGASARFRARRKEKEKESSQMISGLQQELHEMTEERDFYLNERNFYRDLLARTNNAPLPPRPQSPHLRHGLSMGMATAEGSPNHTYGSREGPEMSAQRRRTGDYHPSFTTSAGPSPYTSTYPPPSQNYSVSNTVGPPPPPFPTEHRAQNQSSHVTHPPPPLAPARPQEMNPYRREPIDRWNPSKS